MDRMQLSNPNRKSFKYGIRTSGHHESTRTIEHNRTERSKKLASVPMPNATPEDIEKFRRAMGRA